MGRKLQWITDNHIGDLASIAGLVVSIVGFLVTIVGVWRSKSAAERAERAANEARRQIRAYETVADFSATIALMEEIKRLHRANQLDMLPDRYATLRKALIGVRRLSPSLQAQHDTILQAAVSTLSTMEDIIEKAISNQSAPDFVKMNRAMSKNIDNLHAVLLDIEAAGEGTQQ